MAFHLTRFTNGSRTNSIEPGGSFTLGAVNHTLFTGDIDYQPVDESTGYWTLQIGGTSHSIVNPFGLFTSSDSMTDWSEIFVAVFVQGSALQLPLGQTKAVIDTGTTLVGGPAAAIAGLYAMIPRSSPATGNLQGYYVYRQLLPATYCLAFPSHSYTSTFQPVTLRYRSHSRSARTGRHGKSPRQTSS